MRLFIKGEISMRMYDLITKKKHGEALTNEEIKFMVEGYVKGEIPDYQMSSMLMAIWFKGMNDEEITELTMNMAKSGDMIDLSAIEGLKVDKHSTGGVGDKTTLVVSPIVAACGGKVAKMREDDVLMITADHGCDPGAPGTDHTREYVPLLIYGQHIKQGVNLGTYPTFAMIGATISEMFGADLKTKGESILARIEK